jgi:hypothetical protein
MGLGRVPAPAARAALEDRLAVESDDDVRKHLRRALEAQGGSK